MKVLLGVSGGIAAYKAAELVRAFKKRGDEVRVVMTASAQQFITPLTLQVLSGNVVGTELFDLTFESEIGHIDLARWPDVILLAPATANVIGKLANGLSDDLLSTVVSATRAPVVVAPAMNTQMFLNPATQANLLRLEEFGYHVVDPDQGELACREVGPGRLPDAPVLLDCVDGAVAPQLLAGKRVIVTAGPTREHADPARFISNPSTGKMGFALAAAARELGADVVLVAGPSHELTPYGVTRIDIVSAAQMYEVVTAGAANADFVVKAAAVADWRFAEPSDQKRAKSESDAQLQLERTPDILAALGAQEATPRPYLIGFAAETHDVEARAAAKRKRKNADMIVANSIGGADNAFGADAARVCVITDAGATWLESRAKRDVAREIWRLAVADAG